MTHVRFSRSLLWSVTLVVMAALGGATCQRIRDQKERQRLALRISELEETLVMHAEGRRLIEEGEVEDIRYRLWGSPERANVADENQISK